MHDLILYWLCVLFLALPSGLVLPVLLLPPLLSLVLFILLALALKGYR